MMAEPRFLEDFDMGEIFETESRRVEAEEIVRFAEQHDPQPFHMDEEAARGHPLFRGLSASGFHTLSITHDLILRRDIGHAWGLIGKGIDRLRWKRPVRPGDILRVIGRVVAIERNPEQPYGNLQVAIETINQDAQPVMTMIVNTVVPSRLALAPAKAAA